MEKIVISLMAGFILFSFAFNVFGLMHLIPLYITSPILFVSLFILFVYLNSRKRFRGY